MKFIFRFFILATTLVQTVEPHTIYMFTEDITCPKQLNFSVENCPFRTAIQNESNELSPSPR